MVSFVWMVRLPLAPKDYGIEDSLYSVHVPSPVGIYVDVLTDSALLRLSQRVASYSAVGLKTEFLGDSTRASRASASCDS